ncbi:MAG: helix-turn-helix transcriptional regulator [Caldilineaceae bacterium]|nr:helix-turn-helix transcriptional regulator [Caldilineaceae bacterium]
MDKKLSLAERVLLSRRDLGISQADLAQKAGVSRTYIKDIEVGRVTNVGLNYIVGIAGALGVSLAYLMGMSEDPLSESPDVVLAETSERYIVEEVESPTVRRMLRDLIESFSTLDMASQQLILELLHVMRRNGEDYASPTPPAQPGRDPNNPPADRNQADYPLRDNRRSI